jgi:hypothetical protein
MLPAVTLSAARAMASATRSLLGDSEGLGVLARSGADLLDGPRDGREVQRVAAGLHDKAAAELGRGCLSGRPHDALLRPGLPRQRFAASAAPAWEAVEAFQVSSLASMAPAWGLRGSLHHVSFLH